MTKWRMRAVRSIHALGRVEEQQKIVDTFYVEQMSRMMRKNLDFSTYTPSYDYYEEFRQWLFK